jgi:hypothetical protein
MIVTSRPCVTWQVSSNNKRRPFMAKENANYSMSALAGIFILVVFLVFLRAIFVGTPTPPPKLQSSHSERYEDSSDDVSMGDFQNRPPPPVFLSSEPPTPYDIGFRVGYEAFLKQVGMYTPDMAPKSAYTVLTGMNINEFSEEDSYWIDRGYVDGYHRATESVHCTGGGKHY